ncbi:hypothetical protein J2S06_001626 [Bacillus alveayuensis]|uniref:Uncharacterized protein n=1 Tax=Aeribacillus alveayuensis TaxID=279215 RepID=A0ABT9VNJ4_9BACI|nr:hypothetical protein [Bacillus alveayuensis]
MPYPTSMGSLGAAGGSHPARMRSQVMSPLPSSSPSRFPAHVTSPVQYGPRVKALLVYLMQYQLLPYRRTAELIQDVFDHRISEGTLVKINREAGGCLAGIRSLLHEVFY